MHLGRVERPDPGALEREPDVPAPVVLDSDDVRPPLDRAVAPVVQLGPGGRVVDPGVLLELPEAPPILEPDPRLEPGVGRQVRPLRGRRRLGLRGRGPGRRRGLGLALLPRAEGPEPVADEARAGEDQEQQRGDLEPGHEHHLQYLPGQVCNLDANDPRRSARRKPACDPSRGTDQRRRHGGRCRFPTQEHRQRASRERDATPGEPLRQRCSRPRQPARYRPDRPAELTGRLPMSLALQVAEDDGDAVLRGQAAQLLIQERQQVVPPFVRPGFGLGHLRHLLLSGPPPASHRPGPHGCLVRHGIQPVGDHLPTGDRRGLAGEHEERGLERVLGIVGVAEDASADTPDHGAVTHDEGLERRLVAVGGEPLEELAIRQPAD